MPGKAPLPKHRAAASASPAAGKTGLAYPSAMANPTPIQPSTM